MNSEELSEKLRAWRVEPQVPASFQREVWARIAARQAAREDSFPRHAAEWLASLFAQPRYALALAAVSLALGLGFAHQQAMDASARHWDRLEARYATSVSPFLQQAAHGSHTDGL
jgi:hypothetical protein